MADIEKFVYYSSGSKKVLKPTDRIVIGSGGLAFEGATANDFETELTVTDPTADRSIEFPDEDGEVALLQGDSLPKALSFPVKNPSTTTALTKGQIVYISGHSGNKPEVSLARSNSSSTMPAFGFVQSDIAAEAEGYVVYSGLFKGIDTNTSYSEGDTLYVSDTTAGEFVNTPPTGSNLIQNIGKIVKSDASNGELLVGGAGRTNATPNLDQGKFFIGNASNQSTQSTYTLPITDGTANQVLTTDGNGAVSFANSSAFPSSDTSNSYTTTIDFSNATPASNGNITIPVGKTGHLVLSEDLDSASPSSGDLLTWNTTNQHFEVSNTLEPTVVGLPSNPSTPFSGIKMLQVTNPFGSAIVSSYADYTDSIITELSIPGVDLQTDTNAFRFNCPYGLVVTGLDLYLDQHTTSGNVTVTVTNTTDSASMISLTVSGTNTSATTTTVTNATCDNGDIITFAITATPANAQGLRANLHFTRT